MSWNPFDDALDEVFTHLDLTGRTQADVASALGISQKHLSMIRQNRSDPSLSLCRRLWVEVMRPTEVSR